MKVKDEINEFFDFWCEKEMVFLGLKVDIDKF